tara:strand:- start:1118 stop:1762 length:645 start_codon:yes stop_codon:yes gene_type:complete
MATNIVGSVSLSYGSHSHDESFSTTTVALTDANPFNEYAAGSGRAVTGTSGVALPTGSITGGNEGLLLIKNNNNIGALMVSVDGGSNWDISIPAKVANLISVGPDHAVNVKTPDSHPNVSNADVVSVTTAGAIVFGSSPTVHVGTAIMTASSSGDFADDLIVEIDSATTGTVFELDGTTKKDLKTGEGSTSGYDTDTTVNLVYIARYRYTLTEA